MLEFFQENESLILILGIVSVISFLGTLAFIPWFIIRIPADYFSASRRGSLLPDGIPPSLKVLAFLVKNIIGLIIVLLGIAMLVLPGQGLLMILIGLALVEFPGKYKLERWLISRAPVYKSANWLREKGHKEPLVIE